ncbi:MAG: SAM-dependent methyltransferase [Chitinophagia bacterium]|jgi:16S rRNA (cytidine1402-2'-O)-methyltransferase
MPSTLYLIPIPITEDGLHALPANIAETINRCEVFFVEDLRTARRTFRKIDRQFNIDAKEWHETGIEEEKTADAFKKAINEGKQIGIVSESGCPGIADPGQKLVAIAHEMGIVIKPLTGPSSLLLALMGSGMNGQQFAFNGYLPIDSKDREKKIRELERKVMQEGSTQLFIETPYRNQVLYEALIKTLSPQTRLCIAYHLSAENEWIKTMSVGAWKKESLSLPKDPAVFLIGS